MKRIAIDMDEVMADTAIDHLELFNREYGEHVTLEELEGTTLAGIRPLLRNEIESYFASGQFFRGLKVIPGSQDVIRELQEHYEVLLQQQPWKFRLPSAQNMNGSRSILLLSRTAILYSVATKASFMPTICLMTA